MTFVRAYIRNGGVRISSDWQVTDPNRTAPAGYKDGTLKSLLLSRNICVSYAGDIAECLSAIRESEDSFTSGEVEAALHVLARISKADRSEFVVGIHSPSALYEIKKGVARPCETAWAGDRRAFENYQEEMASLQAEGSTDFMEDAAFRRVVDSGSVPGVGLLTVSIIPTKKGFEYAVSMGIVMGFEDQPIPPHTWTTIQFGHAGSGAFAYSFMGCDGQPAAGVYFTHGNFGLISAPLQLAETTAVQGFTQNAFVENVRSQFNLNLIAGIEVN